MTPLPSQTDVGSSSSSRGSRIIADATSTGQKDRCAGSAMAGKVARDADNGCVNYMRILHVKDERFTCRRAYCEVGLDHDT